MYYVPTYIISVDTDCPRNQLYFIIENLVNFYY